LPNQIGHRADHVLDRHLFVDAMLVEEIDVIGSQPAQGSFHRLADVLGPAVEARDRPVLDAEPELCGNHDLMAPALEGPSEELLVVIGP
jgi:hypothetical protein